MSLLKMFYFHVSSDVLGKMLFISETEKDE